MRPTSCPEDASSRTSTSSNNCCSRTKTSLPASLAEKLLVYATGHKLEYADRETVDRIAAESRAANYGLRSLIHLVVQSELFQSK